MWKKTIAAFSLFIILSSARSQVIDTLLINYNKKVPQEKAYVHFDNSVYSAGETIFFKGYLMIGTSPSWLSRSFYIDWFDQQGKFIDRTVSPVIGSGASGSFTIPHDLKGGHLQAVAYTKWMLNFDSSFLFRKTLRLAQHTQPARVTRKSSSLVFFPEGGDLVEGISSWVSFKANNASGMPVNVQGILKSRSGQVLDSFHSQHDGMGKLQLTPQKGENYFAEWKDDAGNEYRTELPVAKSAGLVLSVANTSGARIFSVERTAQLEPRFQRISVVATMNQQVVYRAVASFTEKTKLVSKLPVENLPTGILRFTVFDANLQPVAERILFVNNNEYKTTPRLQRDSFDFSQRKRNVFEFEIRDTSLASLSVSVTDGDGFYDSSEQIITHLLLTGELKGYVHQPSYYFSPGDIPAAHLDLVMLTHGWRRFRWDHVTGSSLPSLPYQPDTSYLSISGQVKQGSKKEESISFLLTAADSTEQLFYISIQPDGTFRENNLIVFDTAKLYPVTDGTKLTLAKPITFKNFFLPIDRKKEWVPVQDRDTIPPGILSTATRQRELDSLARGTTLQEVVVTAKPLTRAQELNKLYASPLFNAIDEIQLNVIDDPIAEMNLSVLHYLERKIPGLRAYDIFSANAGLTDPLIVWRGEKVIFMLNEFPSDAKAMLSVPMSNVAMIKFFRNSYFGFKTGGAGGVAAVYLKKGGEVPLYADKKIQSTPITGYSATREFYAPDYSMPVQTNSKDYRRTLSWHPNIYTGENNRTIKISFYNNDISNSFRIVMEGVTQDGRLVYFNKLVK